MIWVPWRPGQGSAGQGQPWRKRDRNHLSDRGRNRNCGMDLNPLRYLYITRAKVCKQTIRTVVLGLFVKGWTRIMPQIVILAMPVKLAPCCQDLMFCKIQNVLYYFTLKHTWPWNREKKRKLINIFCKNFKFSGARSRNFIQ